MRRTWMFEANALDSFIWQRFVEGLGVPGCEGHLQLEGAEGACGQDAGMEAVGGSHGAMPLGPVLRCVDVQPHATSQKNTGVLAAGNGLVVSGASRET